jgi:hypothetical protein
VNFNTGRPDGRIGRLDGSRATSLSPVFWCGAFEGVRTGCERDANGLRTGHSGFSTGTASRPDGPSVRPDGLRTEHSGFSTGVLELHHVRTVHVSVRTVLVPILMKLLHNPPRDART